MAVTSQTIRVEGLESLRRAFVVADKEVANDMRDALQEAAAPVRADAQLLASTTIRRIGPNWSRMRVGTTRTIVYVAPVERGIKGRDRRTEARRKANRMFKDMLLRRALEPALERNVSKVVRRVDEMLAEVARTWERTR